MAVNANNEYKEKLLVGKINKPLWYGSFFSISPGHGLFSRSVRTCSVSIGKGANYYRHTLALDEVPSDVNQFLIDKIYDPLLKELKDNLDSGAIKEEDAYEFIHVHLALILLLRETVVQAIKNPDAYQNYIYGDSIFDWNEQLLLTLLTPFAPGLRDIPRVLVSFCVALILLPYVILKWCLLSPLQNLCRRPFFYDEKIDDENLLLRVKSTLNRKQRLTLAMIFSSTPKTSDLDLKNNHQTSGDFREYALFSGTAVTRSILPFLPPDRTYIREDVVKIEFNNR